MRNIGKISQQWLAGIGIRTLDGLRTRGVVNAFIEIRQAQDNKATLNLMWALAGAVENRDWRQLDPGLRLALLAELEERNAHPGP